MTRRGLGLFRGVWAVRPEPQMLLDQPGLSRVIQSTHALAVRGFQGICGGRGWVFATSLSRKSRTACFRCCLARFFRCRLLETTIHHSRLETAPGDVQKTPHREKTMKQTKAYSAASATSPLLADTIRRREATASDVQIEILFCGICHSDLHTVRDEWRQFLCPPPTHACRGTRSSARVTGVGSAVTKYKAGDLVGRRLPGRFGPQLQQLCERRRAVLPGRDLHLQLPGRAPRRCDLRRLLRAHRGRRELRAAGTQKPRPGRRRPSSLRRDHDLLADSGAGVTSTARRSAWSVSAGWGTWA